MKKDLVVDHLQHLADLKLKKDLRKKRSAVIQIPEPTTDNDSISDSDEDTHDDQTDVILNVIQGSDSESDDNDHITVVPHLRTVTRHGRLAGTWRRNFALNIEDSDGESDQHQPQNGKERQAELEVEKEIEEEEETEEEDMETDNEDENQKDMDTEHQWQITQANNMEFTMTRH